MDLPIYLPNLSNLSFEYGQSEFRQTMYLLLKTWYGRFLQGVDLGSRVSPHVSNPYTLVAGASATVEQIPGCACVNVGISGEDLVLRVQYRGRISDFSFSLASFIS